MVADFIDEQYYRDNVDITMTEFWKMFPNLKEQPTTSAVNPGDFLNIFNELSKSVDNIICILVSKILSATQECAYQARRIIRPELPNLNIEIIDSKTSAGAMGFTVLEAARAAQQNKSMAEIIEVVQDIIS